MSRRTRRGLRPVSRGFRLSAGCILSIFLIAIVVFATAFAVFYKSDTEYGECVGLGETQVDSLVYEVPIENVILGIVFIETAVVPAYIVLKDLYCPVGVK